MSEENLKPQIIKTLYNIEESIRKRGISKKDLLLLLQRRIRVKGTYGYKKKMGLKNIEAVLDALKRFERELIRNQEVESE